MALFGFWVMREHLTARKYRYLVRLTERMKELEPAPSVSPRWSVTYKVKGKMKTTIAEGATEPLALLELVKNQGIPYGSIVSSIKV